MYHNLADRVEELTLHFSHILSVVGTPGEGFGPSGEGYFRLTAFNTKENTRAAVERIIDIL